MREARENLRGWIWKCCPFCNSKSEPKIENWSGGGYQESIVLKCPDCSDSLKFVTDWSPIIDFSLVNEIPEMIQDEYCPYLSIKKNKDHIFLRCCSNIPRDCFGRPYKSCFSFHNTRLEEAFKEKDWDKAIQEAEATSECWKTENPEAVPPLGTYKLVEIKRLTLSKADWINWIKEKLNEHEATGDFGTAAHVAFMVAEVSNEPEFWKRASQLYDKYARRLRANLEKSGLSKKQKIRRKILRAEIMKIESLSEIDERKKSALLKLAGNKWLELFKISGDPFSNPQFLYYTYCLRNLALVEPKEASDYYKEAHEFLMSQLDRIRYPREELYYTGYAKYFLALHCITKANYVDEEERKIQLLNQSIDALAQAIELHRKIGSDTTYADIMLHCIKSLVCLENFKKTENFDLIDEATKHLAKAKTYNLPRRHIIAIDALLGSLKDALLAIEEPKRALLFMARARGKLNGFIKLLPSLSEREIPISKMLEASKDYLDLYLEVISKNTTSFAGKKLSFGNIIISLNDFKELAERQLYQAFQLNESPSEEIGRSLVQAYLGGAFPQRVFQFKEVQVAKGKSDNLLIVNKEKYPFEVKIWDGEKYYRKGLNQIQYYLDHENVSYGFYIIFDPRSQDYLSGGEVIKYNTKRIYQIFIHISPSSPTQA